MSPETLALLTDGLKILGPALVAALAAYGVATVQIKSKAQEIAAAGDLKAREGLFTYYRERGDHLRKSSRSFGRELGKLYAQVGFSNPEANVLDSTFIELTAKFIAIASKALQIEFSIAQAELESAGLKDSAEYVRLKELSDAHVSGGVIANRDELLARMEASLESYLYLEHCNQRVLEAQIKELFKPYLNRKTMA